MCRRLCLIVACCAGCSFRPAPGTVEPTEDARGDAPPIDAREVDAISVDANVTGFRARRRITWSGVTADLAGFPLLVRLDATRIDYGRVANDARDLQFVDAATDAALPHEIEEWNEGGSSYVWVRVPLVDAAGTGALWMYYDDPAAQIGEDPATVWSDYTAVWHLNDSATNGGTSAMHVDATGNSNTGTQGGNARAAVAGGIAGVQEFDNADRIRVARTGLQLTGTAATIEARAYARTSENYPHVWGAGSDGRFWQMFYDPDTGGGYSGAFRVNSNDARIRTQAGNTNGWHSVALVFGNLEVTLYVDGVEIADVGASGSLATINTDLWIGNNPVLEPRAFNGYIDELRVAARAHSPAWVSATHRAAIDTLLAFGAEENL